MQISSSLPEPDSITRINNICENDILLKDNFINKVNENFFPTFNSEPEEDTFDWYNESGF